jgi:glycerophosphoryl diester phosphodiesterase
MPAFNYSHHICHLLCIALAGATLLSPALGFADQKDLLIIGHRGMGHAHSPEPENTIPSLIKALRTGVDTVEFDVQLSSDGQVVLAHDIVLDEISTGHGCVSEHTYSELSELQLKDGKGVAHSIRMATLEEALTAISPYDSPARKYLADIHIKVYKGYEGDWGGFLNHSCPPTNSEELTTKALAIVQKMNLQNRVLFTSFYSPALTQLHAVDSSIHLGLLGMANPEGQIRQAAAGNYEVVVFEKGFTIPKRIQLAHDQGLKVFVWTTTGKKDNDRALQMDIDGVITDTVDEALEIHRSLQANSVRTNL